MTNYVKKLIRDGVEYEVAGGGDTLPKEGTAGQVLTKTEDSYEWRTLETPGITKYWGPIACSLGNSCNVHDYSRPDGASYATLSFYSPGSSISGTFLDIYKDSPAIKRTQYGRITNVYDGGFSVSNDANSVCLDVTFYGLITNINPTARSFGNGSDGDLIINDDTTLEAKEYNFSNLTICDGAKLTFSGQNVPVLRVQNEFINNGTIDLYNPFICDSSCIATDYSGLEIKNKTNNYYDCALFLKEEILDKFNYDYLKKAASGGGGGYNGCAGISAGGGGSGGLDGNGSSGGCVYVSGAGYCTDIVGGSGGSGTSDAGGGGGSGASFSSSAGQARSAGNRGGNGSNGIGGCGANSANVGFNGGGGGGGFGCLKGGNGGYGSVGGNGGNSYCGDGGNGGDACGTVCGRGSRTAPGCGGCSYYGNGGNSGTGGYSCYSSCVYGCGGCSVYGNGGFGSTHGGHSIYGNGGCSTGEGGRSLYGEGGCGQSKSGFGKDSSLSGQGGAAFGGHYGLGLFAKSLLNNGTINGKGGNGSTDKGCGADGSDIYIISESIEGTGTIQYTGGTGGCIQGRDGKYKTYYI